MYDFTALTQAHANMVKGAHPMPEPTFKPGDKIIVERFGKPTPGTVELVSGSPSEPKLLMFTDDLGRVRWCHAASAQLWVPSAGNPAQDARKGA